MRASRRRFLQVGLAGAAVLVAARVLDRADAPASPALRVLDARTAAVVAALVPAVLAGMLPSDPDARAGAVRDVVEAFDRAVGGLAPAIRRDIDDLLALLRYPPTRIALAGLVASWEKAEVAAVAAFLERWRASPFALQRSGCQALTQLLQAAWYGNALSWPATGYAGPPDLAMGPATGAQRRAP